MQPPKRPHEVIDLTGDDENSNDVSRNDLKPSPVPNPALPLAINNSRPSKRVKRTMAGGVEVFVHVWEETMPARPASPRTSSSKSVAKPAQENARVSRAKGQKKGQRRVKASQCADPVTEEHGSLGLEGDLLPSNVMPSSGRLPAVIANAGRLSARPVVAIAESSRPAVPAATKPSRHVVATTRLPHLIVAASKPSRPVNAVTRTSAPAAAAAGIPPPSPIVASAGTLPLVTAYAVTSSSSSPGTNPSDTFLSFPTPALPNRAFPPLATAAPRFHSPVIATAGPQLPVTACAGPSLIATATAVPSRYGSIKSGVEIPSHSPVVAAAKPQPPTKAAAKRSRPSKATSGTSRSLIATAESSRPLNASTGSSRPVQTTVGSSRPVHMTTKPPSSVTAANVPLLPVVAIARPSTPANASVVLPPPVIASAGPSSLLTVYAGLNTRATPSQSLPSFSDPTLSVRAAVHPLSTVEAVRPTPSLDTVLVADCTTGENLEEEQEGNEGESVPYDDLFGDFFEAETQPPVERENEVTSARQSQASNMTTSPQLLQTNDDTTARTGRISSRPSGSRISTRAPRSSDRALDGEHTVHDPDGWDPEALDSPAFVQEEERAPGRDQETRPNSYYHGSSFWRSILSSNPSAHLHNPWQVRRP